MSKRLALGMVFVLCLAACSGGSSGGNTHSLVVAVTGSGTVTSAPTGINCTGSTCSANFSAGSSVTLTAAPGNGGVFTGWSGACSGSGACVVTMGQDQSVGAAFSTGLGSHTLSVSVTGQGTVTSTPPGISCPSPSCKATFTTGTQVTLVASATSGQMFSGWGGACSGTGSCMVTMSQDASVTAAFTTTSSVMHTLSVTINGQGAVTSTPAGINCSSGTCTSSFVEGTQVTLAVVVTGGQSFNNWGGACSGSGTCSVTMTQDQSVNALFSGGATGYVLTVALGGDGIGTVTSNPAGINCTSGSNTGCSHDFGPSSGAVALTATASSNSSYAGQGVGGNIGCNGQGDAATCSYGLNNNGVTVNVYFSGWKIRYPFPASAASLVVVGGTDLVVGAGSAASTSTDGLAWTGHVLPQSDLNAAAVNGSGLVAAVGNGGAILTTNGLSTWNGITPVTNNDLSGIAFGASTFVAVGKSGTILHSADGSSWSAASTGDSTTQDLLGVTYGGGLFVAVGYAGTILTSADGAAWTKRGAGVTTQYLAAINYNGTQYLTVGSAGVVLTSPDATTWTLQTTTNIPVTHPLHGVAWSGTNYVAAGELVGTAGAATFASADGHAWTEHDTGLGNETFLGVAYTGGYFYALGASASILRSTDGTSWAQVMVPTGRGSPGMGNSTALGGIAYGNSTFVASGGSFFGIFSSSDGITWTSRHAAPCCGGNFPSIAYGSWATPAPGKAFVIAVESTIYTSADGITWPSTPTYSVGSASYYLSSAIYAAGLFVVVGYHPTSSGYTGIVLTSPDGLTWTDQSATASITTQPYAIAYGAGQFVISGSGAYTSSDGIHWTPESFPSTDLMASMAYGSGLFVTIDGQTGGADTVTSPDGAHWTAHHYTNVTLGAGYGNALTFGNGQFLAPSLATSTDGLTWTKNVYPSGGQINTAIYAAGGWVGVGYAGSFWTHP